jgi:hypothetical protein
MGKGIKITTGHGMFAIVCVVKFVFRCSHVINVSHITVDYIANRFITNVKVISPDGKRHMQLLSSKDGLVKPTVLEYDKSTNRLLVVNECEHAFLFDVTRIE